MCVCTRCLDQSTSLQMFIVNSLFFHLTDLLQHKKASIRQAGLLHAATAQISSK